MVRATGVIFDPGDLAGEQDRMNCWKIGRYMYMNGCEKNSFSILSHIQFEPRTGPGPVGPVGSDPLEIRTVIQVPSGSAFTKIALYGNGSGKFIGVKPQ